MVEANNTNQPLIELRDINKFYPVGKEKLHVLKELNLTIHQGEFILIMGKSGSGKTTLMNIIGFLDRLTDGSYHSQEQMFQNCLKIKNQPFAMNI